MRCAATFVATIALTAPLVASGPAAAQAPEGEGWELAIERDDLRVHRRFMPGSGIVETLTLAKINAPPRRVFFVLTDYTRYPDFMPHFVECRVLSRVENVQLIFQRLRISEAYHFLLKDRYHVVRNVLPSPGEGDKRYRIEWSLDAAAMQNMQVDDAVATRLNTGYWDLQESDGGSATQIRYYLRADPGGAIPKFFANQGTVQSIPAVIDAVRERTRSAVTRGVPPEPAQTPPPR